MNAYMSSGYMREIEGFLDHVDRQCRLFMRTGGGALPVERGDWQSTRKTTPEQRTEIEKHLFADNPLCSEEIARRCGVDRTVVNKMAYNRRVKLPDMRTKAWRRHVQSVEPCAQPSC